MWQVIDPIYQASAVFDFAKRFKSYFSFTESTLVTSLRKKEKEKRNCTGTSIVPLLPLLSHDAYLISPVSPPC
jgi:hypothetical protein